jgi:hypothetical protein
MPLLPLMTQNELETGIAARLLWTKKVVIYVEAGKKKTDEKRLHGMVTCSDHLGVTVAVLDTDGKKYSELLAWDEVPASLEAAKQLLLPVDWETRQWRSDHPLTPHAPKPKVPQSRPPAPMQPRKADATEACPSSEKSKKRKQKKHSEPAKKQRVKKAVLKQVCELLHIEVKANWTVEDIKAAINEAVEDA